MTQTYSSNELTSIAFLNYLLDSNRDTLPASCENPHMLINLIVLDEKLSNANLATTEYRAGVNAKLPIPDLNSLKTTLSNELKGVFEKTDSLVPYFRALPDSFGWKWIGSFKMSLNSFQTELASSTLHTNHGSHVGALQEVLMLAKLGVHAHVDPKDLKILDKEIGEANQALRNYGSALSNNYPSDKLQVLQNKLSKEITDTQLKANEIMTQLDAESNYYKLLTGFSALPPLLTSIAELQTNLEILSKEVDIRLEEMDLKYLISECVGDIMESF